jgi:hypothetical protein
VDVEIFLQVQSINELLAVLVEQEPRHQLVCLQGRPLRATFDGLRVCEVGQGFAEARHLLNFLVGLQTRQCFVQVEGVELGPRSSKELRVDHSIVVLVLVPIQVAHSPLYFEPVYLARLELNMLLQFV